MQITIESGLVGQIECLADIEDFLDLVDGKASTFAILEADNGHFMQTAIQGDGFVLEKQLGGLNQHFEAVPAAAVESSPDTRPFWKRLLSPAPLPSGPFQLDQIKAHFASFAGLAEAPADVTWEKMSL